MSASPEILLGTILLEKNRWKPGRIPSFQISDYWSKFVDAGFKGLEVFGNHLLLADEKEQDRVLELSAKTGLELSIFNAYVPTSGDEESIKARDAVNELLKKFSFKAMKVNIGQQSAASASAEEMESEIAFMENWYEQMPSDLLLFMENHPNTHMDEPGISRITRKG